MPHGRGRPLACVWAAIALLAAGGLLSPSHAQTDSSTTAQGDAVKGARAKTDAAAKTLKRARRLLGDAAVKGTQQQVTDALQTVNDATRAFNDAEAGEAALDPQVVAAERAEQDAEHASDTDPTDKTKADAKDRARRARDQAIAKAEDPITTRVGLTPTAFFPRPQSKKDMRDQLKGARHEMAQAKVTLQTTQALSPNDTAAIDAAREDLGRATQRFLNRVSDYEDIFFKVPDTENYGWQMQAAAAKTDWERQAIVEDALKRRADERKRKHAKLLSELDAEERGGDETPAPSQPNTGDKGDTSAPAAGSVLSGSVLSGDVLQGIGVAATPVNQPNRGSDDESSSQTSQGDTAGRPPQPGHPPGARGPTSGMP